MRRCEAEAEGLKVSRDAEQERFAESDRRLRDAQVEIAALEAKETGLRADIQQQPACSARTPRCPAK